MPDPDGSQITTVLEFFAVGVITLRITWGSCQGWRTA